MSEKTIEKYLKKEVEEYGGFSRKWTSPGHASVPDRIVFLPQGVIWFIEVKAPGKQPTEAQWREIMRLRLMGANAGYLSSEREIDQFLAHPAKDIWMEEHIRKAVNDG